MEGITKQNKNNTLQVLRGIAIIVVLLHHSISRVDGGKILQGIDDILICFHMPIFFIIAGYLYQNKISKYENMGKAKFLVSKAKHLLVPYAFWTILLWGGVQVANSISTSVNQLMISFGFGPMSVKSLIVGLLTYEEYYTEHLWFLYVLFLYFFVHSILGKEGNTKKCCAVGIIIGILTIYVNLPNIIERAMLWFVYFSFGRLIADDDKIKESVLNCNRRRFSLMIVTFAFFSVLSLCFEFDEPASNIYVIKTIKQLIKYIIGFQGVWLLYMLSNLLTAKASTFSRKIFKNIGDYSYDVYLMHNPYIVALGCTVLSSILGLNSLLTIIVATAAGVAIPMIISKFVIRRFSILSKIMLGR